MFGKKKEVKRRSRPAANLAQFGIFQVPDSIENIGKGHESEYDDEDLEAELAALTSGNNAESRPKKAPKRIPDADLEVMISESLKDVNSDEELSGDENDPELLNELQMLTGEESPSVILEKEGNFTENLTKPKLPNLEENIKLLEERLAMYSFAEERAKKENNNSKVRRFGRGIRTLKEMLLTVKSGGNIEIAEIPPVLPPSATSTAVEKPPDKESSEKESSEAIADAHMEENPPEEVVQSIPDKPATPVDQATLDLLKERQQEYKKAAVAWKKSGNTEEALKHVKLVKQFDLVIAAISAGNAVDLSDMPGSPSMPGMTKLVPSIPEKLDSETQQNALDEKPPVQSPEPLTGSSLELALRERLEIYRRTKAVAEGEGNAAKTRRYARICKQFEDALKQYARGNPVLLGDLPTPPGFPPLGGSTPTPLEPVPSSPPNSTPAPKEPSPKGELKKPVVPPRKNSDKKQKPSTSRADKQTLELQKRQQEFKLAALQAKKEGDLELARDYLRQAKRLDHLIEASNSGLPVDMNSIPLSPKAKMQLSAFGLELNPDEGFDLISKEDCLEEARGTDEQIYENLEEQLLKQIKWCLSTRDHCKALGDVPGYNRWERLALGYTRDLDMLRVRKRNGSPPPQHHYEMKTYAIVQSCTDLNDSDVEITIIRGVNLPKEADTYVIFEFPYPPDSPTTDSTSTVRDSCNPEYMAVFSLNGIIDRNSRQCQRAFKRHALKCQVWTKGCSMNPILCCTHPRYEYFANACLQGFSSNKIQGFFKRDNLLGTVTLKLQPLETRCVLHDSFPIMDGRRATGGKLEIKIRIRNPTLTKQIDQIKDKWLIIDT